MDIILDERQLHVLLYNVAMNAPDSAMDAAGYVLRKMDELKNQGSSNVEPGLLGKWVVIKTVDMSEPSNLAIVGESGIVRHFNGHLYKVEGNGWSGYFRREDFDVDVQLTVQPGEAAGIAKPKTDLRGRIANTELVIETLNDGGTLRSKDFHSIMERTGGDQIVGNIMYIVHGRDNAAPELVYRNNDSHIEAVQAMLLTENDVVLVDKNGKKVWASDDVPAEAKAAAWTTYVDMFRNSNSEFFEIFYRHNAQGRLDILQALLDSFRETADAHTKLDELEQKMGMYRSDAARYNNESSNLEFKTAFENWGMPAVPDGARDKNAEIAQVEDCQSFITKILQHATMDGLFGLEQEPKAEEQPETSGNESVKEGDLVKYNGGLWEVFVTYQIPGKVDRVLEDWGNLRRTDFNKIEYASAPLSKLEYAGRRMEQREFREWLTSVGRTGTAGDGGPQ